MAQTYSSEELEAFVSKEVASICDADPTVLAQYVVAIVGTEQPNDMLKDRLQKQLSEFFDGQTLPFINRLFNKMKSADPVSSSSSSNVPSSSGGRFNEFSDEEDDGDRNFKHRRGRSNSRDDQDRGGNKRRLDQDDQNGSSSKYLRSIDNRRSNNNPNSIPVAGNGYNAGQYDNNNRSRGAGGGYRGSRGGGRIGSNMNRTGGGRPQCRDYNEKGFCMRGDMCPYDHGLDRVVVEGNTGPFPGSFPPPGGPIPPMGVRTVPPQNFFGGMPPTAVPDAYDPERSGLMPQNDMSGFPNMPPMMSDMMMNSGMMRGGMRRGASHPQRGGRGGRGFQGRHHNPSNTTLNVEKIPVEHCQIATVNEYFAKFGTITNISVQPHAQKAVIQYSTRTEAEAAYNSPDVIFDNRFVKVYWHKDDTPDAAVAPVAAPVVPAAPKINEPDPELVAARAAELAKEREEKQKKHNEHLQWYLDINKKKEAQLQQQIDEQKRLLAKLTESAGMSAAEKSQLLKDLKNIQKDIDDSKSSAATASQPVPPSGQSSTTAQPTDEKSEPETTEELAKKLARLEAEAANLGIHTQGFRGGRGGYYARGRGSYPRVMRGGMAPRMTLDNRPTKIVAKDIPQDATEAELRQHFEQFGNITSYEQKENEVLVQYGARFEAEKAMAAGPNYSKGKLAVAWFTNSKPTTTTTATTEES